MFSEISTDSKHRFLHIHFQRHNNIIKTSNIKKCMVHTVMEVNNVGVGFRVHSLQFMW